MEKYKEIDDKIRLGYEHVKRSESIEARNISYKPDLKVVICI